MSGPDLPGEAVELLTVGETMACFVPDGDRWHLIDAGAESNVASSTARLGVRTRWVSRVGDDLAGRTVTGAVQRRGVEVVVDVDPDRPTGLLLRELSAGKAVPRYYRRGSAASRLDLLPAGALGDARWLHVTGITPALSREDSAFVRDLLTTTSAGRTSMDINLRAPLWPDLATAREVLTDLARLVDLVFVGDDEARLLFGSDDATVLRTMLDVRGERVLVLKRGSGVASWITADREIAVPALPAHVLDPTGAGDAFAAGVLAGALRGLAPSDCLELGHLMGRAAVQSRGDVPERIPEDADRLLTTTMAPGNGGGGR
jgi:2-dehydro-3-deoxygluconokinase